MDRFPIVDGYSDILEGGEVESAYCSIHSIP